jgi:hypothetical protein
MIVSNSMLLPMGVCILLRVYQIKSLDKASFATSIVRILFRALFYVHNMFRP